MAMLEFQFWNDKSFQSYGPEEQRSLNDAFNGARPGQVHLPGNVYYIDAFDQVALGHASQINARTGFRRAFRIKPPYQLPGATPMTLPTGMCHFAYEEGGNWVPYGQETQQELVLFARSAPLPQKVFFSAGGLPYFLLGLDHLPQDSSGKCMHQVNLKTQRSRNVRLIDGPAPAASPSPSASSMRGSVSRSTSGLSTGSRGPYSSPPTPMGYSSASASGHGSRSKAAPAQRDFSLASAQFFAHSHGRPQKVPDPLAAELLRQIVLPQCPQRVTLSTGDVVENLQALLELGSTGAIAAGTGERHLLELKLPLPEDGEVRLPAELDEDQTVDIHSIASYISDQEILDLSARGGQYSECAICLCAMEPSGKAPASTGPVLQLRCGHAYHTECLQRWFAEKRRCPRCNQEFGKQVGKQPRNASLSWHRESFSLAGHEKAAHTIVIQFRFPSGVDDEGKPYEGRNPKGYLPGNAQGVLLLELFKVAFRRRVMFGLGTSMTFNSYRPTFNIHIKTSTHGGATKHGYPDPDYFQRSLDELKSNGVTLADLQH
eukprot:TRINITY_DN47520_c0_g1_i1.p1 TRINITY_DN47520_c0_g1~~TRINITY_DN47520_c0_g1_i1.p1  ORF type:complete len:545 (+),score=93.15 TRINITY_DN47520_c0_g1_i1:32-1666(+)